MNSTGDRYRQNYCDLYPQTRRRNRAFWSALLGVSIFIIVSGFVLLAQS